MTRHKWIVGVRNQLANLWGECDSAAAIEGAKMIPAEREQLKELIKKAVNWIDKKMK